MTAKIYSTAWCPWCDRAKAFLDQRGIAYEEIDIEREFSDPRGELERISGRLSVPQIFLGETHVGGFDDLIAADRSGKLDELIGT